jgi:hypothetical protein
MKILAGLDIVKKINRTSMPIALFLVLFPIVIISSIGIASKDDITSTRLLLIEYKFYYYYCNYGKMPQSLSDLPCLPKRDKGTLKN